MKLKNKIQIVGVLFVFGMMTLAQHAFADDATVIKLGVVDMQKAIQTSEKGKKAKAQLEKEFNAKKSELQKEETKLKKDSDEFSKQASVLSEEARNKKGMELQERIQKHQAAMMKAQNDIQQKEAELTSPIVTALRDIIKDLAKKKNYTVVLEKNENTVLYSLDKDDLTSEVVTAYNKK
jgi:outer membrane protein